MGPQTTSPFGPPTQEHLTPASRAPGYAGHLHAEQNCPRLSEPCCPQTLGTQTHLPGVILLPGRLEVEGGMCQDLWPWVPLKAWGHGALKVQDLEDLLPRVRVTLVVFDPGPPYT